MPAEGVELTHRELLLSPVELQRLMALFVSEGVSKLRFTGGEPLVRSDIADIVQAASELKAAGVHTVALTTNGLVLNRKLDSLVRAGLTHINISLDTLHAGKFELISRRAGHERVVAAVEQSVQSISSGGLQSVKLNCVVQRGVNEDELCDFVALTRDRDVEVRFIEYMPFDGNRWSDRRFMPYADMLADIRKVHPTLQPVRSEKGAVSKVYRVEGWKGRVGFISSMSEHFCGDCNRLRITADGQLKVCLFDNKEVSLRDAMRGGYSDDELRAVVALAVRGKKASHAGMDVLASKEHRNRPMITIGGWSDFPCHPPPLRTSPYRSAVAATHHSLALRSLSSVSHSLSHVDASGRPTMVDVSSKPVTARTARAQSIVWLPPAVSSLFRSHLFAASGGAADVMVAKGPVITTAIIAGTQAVKATSSLIPFCHPLVLDRINIAIQHLAVDDSRLSHSAPPYQAIAPSSASEPTLPPSSATASEWSALLVDCTVGCAGKTGVEMEALTGASIAALTLYDMLKAVSQEMIIADTRVTGKEGGKSQWGRQQMRPGSAPGSGPSHTALC